MALLAWAILRTQLFDIDVKLRWTVKQSTVAAAFVAVFFTVEQTTQNVLGQYGPAFGIAAAALLLFAIAPLQRVAERFARAAVPAPRPLEASERASIYRDSVAQAWADGSLDRSERLMLDRLRERLGLTRDEASRIESDGARG